MLLLIFTLSITPKKYLHDCIADHNDFYSFNLTKDPSVSKAGFDCDCEDVVVSSPFIENCLHQFGPPPVAIDRLSVKWQPFYFQSTLSTKDSRGPPALV